MSIKRFLPLLSLSPLLTAAPLVIADFESDTFGDWQTTGDAFGKGPVAGAVNGQQKVTDFTGERFANSFHGGDQARGTLTSPEFEISAKFITFQIGGGAHADRTCMNLIIDGDVVRTAVGPNSDSGGTEALVPQAWDVGEFAGKTAKLQIVDQFGGGWGHVTVDQIVATDDKGDVPIAKMPRQSFTRTLTIERDYLNLPLVDRETRQGEGVAKFEMRDADGELLRFMRLKFPEPGAEPDFTYSLDVTEFKGQEITLSYTSHDPDVLSTITAGNERIIGEDDYAGEHRPQFHFSPRRGWMNDVNGTYYKDGLYHLFYQHNPYMTGTTTGFDMHWGHSVSKDLIHWEEYPVALYPDSAGNIFSGTAIVVDHPLPGAISEEELPAPLLFFSGTSPFSQHIAYTKDDGKTWQRYEGNPVIENIGHGDRDPKVVWHEESGHYCMVLYIAKPNRYHIFRSKNLVDWEMTQTMPGWFECPEFFAVKSPTTGEDMYLLYGSYRGPLGENGEEVRYSSAYQLGNFDGQTFTPITEPRPAHNGGNFYAALTFMNEPKGRKIMMGWASGTRFPGEPFNQCATVPLRMQLKAKGGKDILCYEPAVEVEALRGEPIIQLTDVTGAEANEQLKQLKKTDALDVVITFAEEQSTYVNVNVRGKGFGYEPGGNKISYGNVEIHPEGEMDARFLIDRALIESFWNGGEAAYSVASRHTADGPAIQISDKAQIKSITVYPMANIWK